MMRQFVKLSALLAMLLALPILAHANGLPVFTELAASAGKSVVFISTEKQQPPHHMGSSASKYRRAIRSRTSLSVSTSSSASSRDSSPVKCAARARALSSRPTARS